MSVCGLHTYWMRDGEMSSITEDDTCPALRDDFVCAYKCDISHYVDECPRGFAPILRALPTATDEQVEVAIRVLASLDYAKRADGANAYRPLPCNGTGRKDNECTNSNQD